MIIDAENLIVGRLGTFVAKKALMGEKIDIVNCEKPKMPDRFVRRIIRGMLPIEKKRGREAFKRVMCWIGVPDKFKNEKIEKLDKINVLNTKNIKFLDIRKICKFLGGKER